MFLGMRGPGLDPRVDPMFAKILILVLAPQFTPRRAIGNTRPAAAQPHLGIQVTRFLGGELLTLRPPGGDQQMRVPVRRFCQGSRQNRRNEQR